MWLWTLTLPMTLSLDFISVCQKYFRYYFSAWKKNILHMLCGSYAVKIPKTRAHLYCIFNTMVADDLAIQNARTSAVMILTQIYPGLFLVSAIEGLRPCHTFPGRLHRLFVCMDFPARRKSSAGKPIFWKFCVYFRGRMQGTCGSVVSVLLGMRATLRDGAWKLCIRYRQHTCTARYRHVNSVVNARELHARCKGTWTYKN